MLEAVVKVFATIQASNYSSPWQASLTQSSTGSGVVVSPGRVLTGAHVIADATFLELQKLSNPDKTIARVVAVCHDSDLALLEVEDPKFLADIEPVLIGELPALQDRVSVVGYPVGGEELSITEGVVSRIEVQTYSHSQRRLLTGTVDAAINDGNSGGPVVKDDQVVGIAFQSMEDAENIGEMVPTPVIRHFLQCVESGKQPIIPSIGSRWQTMENPTLRRAHGLGEKESGVLVLDTAYGSSCWGHLKPLDVVHSIQGHAIANNGTVQYKGRFRMAWFGLLCEMHLGEEMRLEVTRDGKRQEVRFPLREARDLVRSESYDRRPTYFIYGGVVFQPLTLDYLREWNRWWQKAPRELVHKYYQGTPTEAQQELVVLSMVLADRVNVGYEDISESIVAHVGGVVPRNMAHFVELVDGAEGLLRIETSAGLLLVLDASEVAQATPRIMERYRVPSDRSQDLALSQPRPRLQA